MSLGTSAQEYRQLGLSVFPVGRDKRPLIEWKTYQDKLPHPDEIDAWWERWPDANIGVATGKVSGLVVLDADGPTGLASLKSLETPATTWLSQTGRIEGGWQQFLRHPGDVRIGNRAGLKPGLDVRGDGGYVIVPPSVHASGRCYEWKTAPADLPLAPLPGSVLRLLLTPDARGGQEAGAEAGVIPAGARNDHLYRQARSMAARGLGAPAVVAALLEENRTRCQPPLPDSEVRALVEHAATQPHRADFGNGAPRIQIAAAVPASAGTLTVPESGMIGVGQVALLRYQLEVRRETDPVDAENTVAAMEERVRRALARGSLRGRELSGRSTTTGSGSGPGTPRSRT